MTGRDQLEVAAADRSGPALVTPQIAQFPVGDEVDLGVVDADGPVGADRVPRHLVALHHGVDAVLDAVAVAVGDGDRRIPDAKASLPEALCDLQVRRRVRGGHHDLGGVGIDVGNVAEDAASLIGAEVVVDDLDDLGGLARQVSAEPVVADPFGVAGGRTDE